MQHQVDILFVINDLKFLKSHRIDLINFLVSKGLKVSVATNLEGAKLDEVEKIQKNIGLVNFKFSRSSLNLFTNILALTNLFKIIRKTNPSKILLVSSKPIIYGGLATIFNFKREVCCLISGMGYAFISSSLRSRIVKNIILILYRAAHFLWVQTY